ncbi:hypothetical protein MLD38_012121 [Melastoma candidum]|uniref:Uncharacterized protein n=1 Tax=Melastoma candidum TaxID=119954 RepID=A0ACB9R4X5_9MYRT|nr:hypothetical protein MLD38_012121 [Melastoma candidum]
MLKRWLPWLAFVARPKLFQLSGSTRFNVGGSSRAGVCKTGFVVRADLSGEAETGRRAMLGLVVAGIASGSFAKAVMAVAKPIKVGPPPPPSSGLCKSSIPPVLDNP